VFSVTPLQPDIETFLRAAQVLSEELQHDEILAKAIDVFLALSDASRLVFTRWEAGKYWIRAHGSVVAGATNCHVNTSLIEATRDDLPLDLHDLTFYSDGIVVVDNPVHDSRVSADPYIATHRPRSVLCFENLNSRSHKRFIYFEHDSRPEAFPVPLIQILRALSEHLGIALENAALFQRLEGELARREQSEIALRVSEANLLQTKHELELEREKLRRLAAQDWLTELWNRRAVSELLSSMLARAARERSSLTLIMVDIDHFKMINDQWGHLAGDSVLQEVAHRLRTIARQSDVVGRYGGEEFIIILSGCAGSAAIGMANRLRAGIGDRVFSVDATALRVTCSIGVSWTRDGQYRDQQLMQEADDALYQAKQAGRNRVEVATACTVRSQEAS
jgi:diguanylate cyclase (GGDEF)-like protein